MYWPIHVRWFNTQREIDFQRTLGPRGLSLNQTPFKRTLLLLEMSASQVTAVRRDDNANSTLTEENKINSENGSK